MILRSDPDSWREVARAFMTTDTFPKLRAKTFRLGDREVRMIGIDKGAGMIHPAMTAPSLPPSFGASSGQLHATMLGLIATDAAVHPGALQKALNRAVSRSFNCICVDGDMSTNDTILLLANGQSSSAGEEIDESSPHFELFVEQLTEFCQDLSKLIVRDGEGAEKFVEISCTRAPRTKSPRACCRGWSHRCCSNARSTGEDANWGPNPRLRRWR